MMQQQQVTLLDELARRMGCAYLSDLHRQLGSSQFRACIFSMEPGKYPLPQWQEAVDYLLRGQAAPCPDEAAARLRLTQAEA